MFIRYFVEIRDGMCYQITDLRHERSHLIRSQPFNHSKLHFLKDFSLEFSFHNVYQRKNGTSYTDNWKKELCKTQ